MKTDIVDFAYQIIDMNRKIEQLEHENEELRDYKEKYMDLLDSSMSHNASMMGNILNLCMTPGVIDACRANNTFTQSETL
jgi:hypothetical protein